VGTQRACDVARAGPPQQLPAEHEARIVVLQNERAVGEFVERWLVPALRVRVGIDALAVQLQRLPS
jgi:hypothetical protein